MQRSSPFLFMFEKFTKRFASKATDSALEGVAQTLNEKIGPHIDMIQIGLVFGVIALGTHITKRKNSAAMQTYIPAHMPDHRAPITINNYYREREDNSYERNKKGYYCIQNGKGYRQPPQKTYTKR